jgi:hypothetical protein
VASEDRLALRIVNLFRAFRKTPWFRVTYIILLGLVVSLMFFLVSSALTCLVVILMPLIVFLFPYFFGERKVRRFAVNGLPVFLIAIVVATAIYTQSIVSPDQAVPLRSFPGVASPTMALSNGTVSPYHADPSHLFTFKVKLTTTVNGTPAAYRVYLNLTVFSGFSTAPLPANMTPITGADSSNNTMKGTFYEAQMNLTEAVYLYGFSVWDRGSNWTFSSEDFAPLIAPWGTYYGLFLYIIGTSMLIPLTFYYLILFLWWYTARSREIRTRQLGKTLEIPKEKPESKDEPPGKPRPEPAEKAAKAAAYTCTNCGADVGEDEEKCPKCGAVFEA